MSTVLDRAWIEARIPHKGGMCLLDEVRQWDETVIICGTASHRAASNPLRVPNAGARETGGEAGVGIAIGIEYAAQAMAIHGALLDKEAEGARVGYLTSTRDVAWHAASLSDIEGDLTVRAERLSAAGGNVLYQFQVRDGERVLLSGRATVVLNAPA